MLSSHFNKVKQRQKYTHVGQMCHFLFQYTSEDLYHVATEMTLMCHYCCFNIQVRISTMQLQKLHWCVTTLVSIYKWGSLPCSYRNDTDVPLLLFQYTSEDLYHAPTTEMTLMCHYSCFNIQVRISTMQLQKWHWCATTLVSIYKWGSLPCSYRNDTDVPLLLFQYTSEDLYHAATEMTLMCHYSCFNIQVRISTMQLQKWHWCATTLVSIYKWGSLPCSYRNDTDVPLLLFQYTSEDLYHAATEMTLMCHYSCFNIQVRISTMQLQKWHWCATTLVSIYKWGSLPCSYRNDTDVPLLLFQYTSEDLYHAATEMTLMCHYSCFNIQVRISTMQLQKWHWCATTGVSIYKWGSLPCSYRNDTDVPLLLFQYTSEDLYHAATEMTLMCHYSCFNIQVRISTMQLQKWHWCATLVSIYKWGSLPCSYRNAHYSCFNIQVRISTM